MVSSGSFNTSTYTLDGTTIGLLFGWEISSQSIANNQTIINWTLTGVSNKSAVYYFKSGAFKVTIDGEVVYQTSQDDRIELYGGRLVASGTKVLSHDESGNRKFSAYVEAGIYYYAVNCSGSDSWDLTQIPRYATILIAPDFNDEENPTIIYSNPAGENVDSLTSYISLDGSEETISCRELSKTGSSYTFELTDDERNVLLDAVVGSNSRTVYFILKTVLSGIEHGESVSKRFSVIDGEPVLAPIVEDCNEDTLALTGDSNSFVKYHSNASYVMNAEAQKRAVIAKQVAYCGGKAAMVGELGVIYNVESADFTFEVTDNRGNLVSVEPDVAPTLIEYVKLTCDLNANAPDADGNMKFSVSGNCFNGSFGVEENVVQVFYRYKENYGEYGEWIEANAVLNDDNTYCADISITGLNYLNRYTFQAKAVDMLATVESIDKTVKTIPVFDWGENDFNFNVPVNNLMLVSPNGTVYEILVDDSGDISTMIIN